MPSSYIVPEDELAAQRAKEFSTFADSLADPLGALTAPSAPGLVPDVAPQQTAPAYVPPPPPDPMAALVAPDQYTPGALSTAPPPGAPPAPDGLVTPDQYTPGAQPAPGAFVAPTGTTDTGNNPLDRANQFLGNAYVWGGKSAETGFDCSGLAGYLTTGQAESTVTLYGKSGAVGANELQRGDLVFYNMNQSDMHIQHVGVYIGDGKLVQAGGSARTVNVADVNQSIGGEPEFRRINNGQAAPITTAPTTRQGNSGQETRDRVDVARGQSAFVAQLTPLAAQVERETGIPASVLMAIPANETGWGGSVAGNNLYGIKGSNPTTGANTGAVNTWEVVDGKRVDIKDTFRSYDNPIESMRDFAAFLRDNPRYAKAIETFKLTGNAADLVHGIHDAGYATDPDWANKVLSIASKLPAAAASAVTKTTSNFFDRAGEIIGAGAGAVSGAVQDVQKNVPQTFGEWADALGNPLDALQGGGKAVLEGFGIRDEAGRAATRAQTEAQAQYTADLLLKPTSSQNERAEEEARKKEAQAEAIKRGDLTNGGAPAATPAQRAQAEQIGSWLAEHRPDIDRQSAALAEARAALKPAGPNGSPSNADVEAYNDQLKQFRNAAAEFDAQAKHYTELTSSGPADFTPSIEARPRPENIAAQIEGYQRDVEATNDPLQKLAIGVRSAFDTVGHAAMNLPAEGIRRVGGAALAGPLSKLAGDHPILREIADKDGTDAAWDAAFQLLFDPKFGVYKDTKLSDVPLIGTDTMLRSVLPLIESKLGRQVTLSDVTPYTKGLIENLPGLVAGGGARKALTGLASEGAILGAPPAVTGALDVAALAARTFEAAQAGPFAMLEVGSLAKNIKPGDVVKGADGTLFRAEQVRPDVVQFSHPNGQLVWRWRNSEQLSNPLNQRPATGGMQPALAGAGGGGGSGGVRGPSPWREPIGSLEGSRPGASGITRDGYIPGPGEPIGGTGLLRSTIDDGAGGLRASSGEGIGPPRVPEVAPGQVRSIAQRAVASQSSAFQEATRPAAAPASVNPFTEGEDEHGAWEQGRSAAIARLPRDVPEDLIGSQPASSAWKRGYNAQGQQEMTAAMDAPAADVAPVRNPYPVESGRHDAFAAGHAAAVARQSREVPAEFTKRLASAPTESAWKQGFAAGQAAKADGLSNKPIMVPLTEQQQVIRDAAAPAPAAPKPQRIQSLAKGGDLEPGHPLYQGRGAQDTAAVSAGESDSAGSTRFGPGRYWSDSRRTAEVFAEYRGEGATVNTRPMPDGLTLLDTDKPDTSTPAFAKLRSSLIEAGFGAADVDRLASGKYTGSERGDFFAIVGKKLPTTKSEMWHGADALNQLVRSAGYDGIVGYTRDSTDVPSNTEVVLFDKPGQEVDHGQPAGARAAEPPPARTGVMANPYPRDGATVGDSKMWETGYRAGASGISQGGPARTPAWHEGFAAGEIAKAKLDGPAPSAAPAAAAAAPAPDAQMARQSGETLRRMASPAGEASYGAAKAAAARAEIDRRANKGKPAAAAAPDPATEAPDFYGMAEAEHQRFAAERESRETPESRAAKAKGEAFVATLKEGDVVVDSRDRETHWVVDSVSKKGHITYAAMGSDGNVHYNAEGFGAAHKLEKLDPDAAAEAVQRVHQAEDKMRAANGQAPIKRAAPATVAPETATVAPSPKSQGGTTLPSEAIDDATGQPPERTDGGRNQADGARLAEAEQPSRDAGLRDGRRVSGAEGPGDDAAGGQLETQRPADPRGVGPGDPGGSAGPLIEQGRDYRLSAADEAWQEHTPALKRFESNVDAVRRVTEIAAGRPIEPADLEAFARYSGMGASDFNDGFPTGASKPNARMVALGKQLRELLGDAEYNSMARSRLNAHYTTPTVVKAMWGALEAMGASSLPSLKVLEPSAGSGRFISLMPEGLHDRAAITAVEMDLITGEMLKHLYPQATVHVLPFQRLDVEAAGAVPDNSQDIVISNVPFGKIKVADPAYMKHPELTEAVHNYFFAKGLDKARPGGIVAFITSHYTFDAGSGGRTDFRRYLHQRADLVGGIRLPSGAFPDTRVTTDILFFRKRDGAPAEGEPEPGWVTANPHTFEFKGEPLQVSINSYFTEHPEMALGEHGVSGQTTDGTPGYVLHLDKSTPIEAQLAAAFKRLPKDVMTPRDEVSAGPSAATMAAAKTTEGSFLEQDGKLLSRAEGKLRPAGRFVTRGTGADKARTWAPYSPGEVARIRDMVNIHDLGRAILDLQRAGAPNKAVALAQAQLKRAYDTFVRANGPLHTQTNRSLIRSDARNFWLQSLEKWSEPLEKAFTKRTEKVTLAELEQLRGDIFHKTVQAPAGEVRVADTPKDALMVVLNETGTLDLKRMSQLLGRPVAEITADLARDGLIYRVPPPLPVARVKATPAPNPYTAPRSTRVGASQHGAFAEGQRAADGTSRESPESYANRVRYGAADDGTYPSDLARAFREGLAAKPIEPPTPRPLKAATPWEMADEYLSGKVKLKLAEARAAGPKFAANVAALEKVQPATVPQNEIDVRLGSSWVPEDDINQFVGETFLKSQYVGGEARGLRTERTFSLQRTSDSVRWWPTSSNQRWMLEPGKAEQFGTTRMDPIDLVEHALNAKNVRITDRDINDKAVFNEEATRAANGKLKAIKDEFLRWVWADAERADRLSQLYNDTFNDEVLRLHDGSHLEFANTNPSISLRGHQKDAVWRAIQSRAILLAHEVGYGKSMTMAAIAMELKRLGLANKPAIVVPNHLVGQMAGEFFKLYPQANILVPSAADYQADGRAALMARIAGGDWDAVIIPQSQFKLLPVHPKTALRFMDELRGELQAVVDDFQGDRKARNFKDLQKRLENAAADVQRAQDRLRDFQSNRKGELTYDDLGIDSLMVDEADAYKNLEFFTTRTRVKGLPNSKSDRAFDMHMKSKLLLETKGRGLVFATGTPISNTIAELWTMMRYLQPDTMKEIGLSSFDAWASAFADTVEGVEQTITGEWKNVQRFAKFGNAPELSKLFQKVADIRMSEDSPEMEAKKPPMKGGRRTAVKIDPLPWHKEYLETLLARAKALSGKPEKGADNMLSITSDARKASLDPTLVKGPEHPNGKIRESVANLVRIHGETAADRGTQLVFLDLGTPKSSDGLDKSKLPAELKEQLKQQKAAAGEAGWDAAEEEAWIAAYYADHGLGDPLEQQQTTDVYNRIKRLLIESGIPEHEIAFIHEPKNDKQRVELFRRMNAGEARILIGSTEKMGAGTNVQQRLAAIHHLDTPWRPRDLEQREGRGLRPGNVVYGPPTDEFGNALKDSRGEYLQGRGVEVLQYTTEWPFDAYLWSTLLAKMRAIKGFVRRKVTARSLVDADEHVLDLQEFEALASGDPMALRRHGVSEELRQLDAEAKDHLSRQATARRELKRMPEDIAAKRTSIAQAEADQVLRDKTGDTFSITIEGRAIGKRADAAAPLVDSIKRLAAAETLAQAEWAPMGTIKGFRLEVKGTTGNGFALRVVNPAHPDAPHQSGTIAWADLNPAGVVARVENLLKQIDTRLTYTQGSLRDLLQKQQANARFALQPYQAAGRLEQLQTAVRMMESFMTGEKGPDGTSLLYSADDIAAQLDGAPPVRADDHVLVDDPQAAPLAAAIETEPVSIDTEPVPGSAEDLALSDADDGPDALGLDGDGTLSPVATAIAAPESAPASVAQPETAPAVQGPANVPPPALTADVAAPSPVQEAAPAPIAPRRPSTPSVTTAEKPTQGYAKVGRFANAKVRIAVDGAISVTGTLKPHEGWPGDEATRTISLADWERAGPSVYNQRQLLRDTFPDQVNGELAMRAGQGWDHLLDAMRTAITDAVAKRVPASTLAPTAETPQTVNAGREPAQRTPAGKPASQQAGATPNSAVARNLPELRLPEPGEALARLGIHTEMAEGRTSLDVEDLATRIGDFESRYTANDRSIATLEQQLVAERSDTSAERPPWAIGFSNEAILDIAREHGVTGFEEAWWDSVGLSTGSGEVRAILEEGSLRRSGSNARSTAPATELKRLRAEQADLLVGAEHITDHAETVAFFAAAPETTALPWDAPYTAPEPRVPEARSPQPAEEVAQAADAGIGRPDAPPRAASARAPAADADLAEAAAGETLPATSPATTAEAPAEAAAPAHEFQSTQVNLPPELAAKIKRYQRTIDPEDLAEGGLEDQPHITLKYGLSKDVLADDVRRTLADQGAMRVTFGANGTFPAGKDGVPLYVKVESTDLHRLNGMLTATLPNTETHPEYTPHVTIAYLKPEAAAKYDGEASPLSGANTTLDTVTFSDQAEQQTHLQLTGRGRTPAAPKPPARPTTGGNGAIAPTDPPAPPAAPPAPPTPPTPPTPPPGEPPEAGDPRQHVVGFGYMSGMSDEAIAEAERIAAAAKQPKIGHQEVARAAAILNLDKAAKERMQAAILARPDGTVAIESQAGRDQALGAIQAGLELGRLQRSAAAKLAADPNAILTDDEQLSLDDAAVAAVRASIELDTTVSRRQTNELARALNQHKLEVSASRGRIQYQRFDGLVDTNTAADTALETAIASGDRDLTDLEIEDILIAAEQLELSTPHISDDATTAAVIAKIEGADPTPSIEKTLGVSTDVAEAITARPLLEARALELVRLTPAWKAARAAGDWDRVANIERQRAELIASIDQDLRDEASLPTGRQRADRPITEQQRDVERRAANSVVTRMRTQLRQALRTVDPERVAELDAINSAIRQLVLEQEISGKDILPKAARMAEIDRAQANARGAADWPLVERLEKEHARLLDEVEAELERQLTRPKGPQRPVNAQAAMQDMLGKPKVAAVRARLQAVISSDKFPTKTIDDRIARLQRATRKSVDRAEVAALVKRLRELGNKTWAPGHATENIAEMRDIQRQLRQITSLAKDRASSVRESLYRQGLKRFIGKETPPDRLKEMITLLMATDPEKPEQLGTMLRMLRTPNVWDKLRENGMLSMLASPMTWGITGVNVLSNTMMMAGRLAVAMPLDAVHDAGRYGVRGKPRHIFFGEVGSALAGGRKNLSEAARIARQIWLTGRADDANRAAIETGDLSTLRREYLSEGKRLGWLFQWMHRISTRPLAAADAFQGFVMHGMMATSLAKRKAETLHAANDPYAFQTPADEGGVFDPDGTGGPFQGPATKLSVQQVYEKILRNPWDHQDILDEAGRIEDWTLLRMKPAAWFQAFSGLRTAPRGSTFGRELGSYLLHSLLPFMNVAYNFSKIGIEHSAAGAIYQGVRYTTEKDPIEQARRFRIMLSGALIAALGAALMMDDNLTGDGPTDAGDRNTWADTHQRNSIRIGGHWLSYDGTFFAVPLSVIANFGESYAEAAKRQGGKMDAKSLTDTMAAGIVGGGKGAVYGITSQSFVRNLGDVQEIIAGRRDPGSLLGNFVNRHIPLDALVGFLSRIGDPYERQQKGFTDTIIARSPWRQSLRPQLSALGHLVKNEQMGLQGLVPFKVNPKPEQNDPIIREFERLDVNLPGAPRTVKEIPLTPDEQWEYERVAGAKIEQAVTKLMQSKSWPGRSDGARATVLKGIVESVREEMAGVTLTSMGKVEIRRRALELPPKAKAA